MLQRDGKEQFGRDVFPAELDEINKRRNRLNLREIPPERVPSARLGIVGLALSGGGIRSATFSLGVIQALAKHGLLRAVDYLSTVSGGGFIGSCLSSVLNDRDAGPEQERFPLHFKVGAEEPLALGHLRDSARYLAPGGVLDKVRIPALVLRGVLSNLLIFLLIIMLMVLATEMIYEVGTRLRLPFGYLALGGLAAFVMMVIGSPLIGRLLRGRSTWAQRNLEEMWFTVALVLLLSLAFLVPMFILVDQAIDSSWSEVKESVTADLLRPFEPRDFLQWVVVLVLLVVFMLAGRASEQVSRLGGKLILFTLGLLGPAVLVLIYFALLVMEIDSPYVTPNELFSLDAKYTEHLSDSPTVSPDLRRRFRDNGIRLSKDAEAITLQEDLRWLIRDSERAYAVVREQYDLSVYPDFQDALNRGKLPPELIASLENKGYVLDPATLPVPELRENRYEIAGSHDYWVNYDRDKGEWSLEQIVDGPRVIEALQSASYDLPISDAPQGILIHEGVSLSDDDTEQALRFVEEANPHDVVVVVDNSTPLFGTPSKFKRAFRKAMEEALKTIRPTVRMAVFWFDEDVHTAGGLTPLTTENKQALLKSLNEDGDRDSPRLDFQGRLSNGPAALVRAMRELTEKGREGVRKSIVFISDGIIEVTAKGHDKELEDWTKQEFASDAERAGIRVFGIALSRRAKFGLFHSLARNTGGVFYPVFETRRGITSEDVSGVIDKLREAAGGRMATPLERVSITDQRENTRYTLTLSKDGIRIRVTLKNDSRTPVGKGLLDLTGQWRKVFEENGIELSERATVTRVGDGRWKVSDPYRYTIHRSGRKLMVTAHEEDQGVGLLALLDRRIPSSVWDGSTDWVFLGVLAILIVYWLAVDINVSAAHRFYRDRLSKAYLFRVTGSGAIQHNDRQKLSGLNTEGSASPYHLINVALNLQGSKDPNLRGRSSDFFVCSKRFTGSLRTGFLETERLEEYDGNYDLGTAMAISGAAAAPNMGVTTVKPLVFIMALLNFRLGYWLPNPRIASEASWLTRLALRRGPGPKYLLRESLGYVETLGRYVNVSDGGHIENLGIYELLRRRCQFIIAVDGGTDPSMRFGSLVQLLLYARIDMGIEIELNLDPIRKDAEGLSTQHWVLGTIRYADGEIGHLLYIKSSVTGDEYEYVREYRSRNPNFPHEPSAEQFFNETQFEAYRALGYHIGDQLFANSEALGEFRRLKTPEAADGQLA